MPSESRKGPLLVSTHIGSSSIGGRSVRYVRQLWSHMCPYCKGSWRQYRFEGLDFDNPEFGRCADCAAKIANQERGITVH